jgi:hypothetical protein
MVKKSSFPVLILALLAFCGCSSITNLSPAHYPRSENGYYRVEASWKSNQQTIREDSFQPQVVVGLQKYPMHPVALVQDRWEAYIPVPATQSEAVYHYQFDYLKNAFHRPQPDSKQSAEYTLKIVEKK